MVELLPAEGPRFDHPHGETEALGDTFILTILGTAGVVGMMIFALKDILDRLPELFASWRRVRRAWRGEPEEGGGTPGGGEARGAGDAGEARHRHRE
ncbi:hypothetical protein ACGFX2_11155 [Streptomyces goshikiensis]|uniref:hypothetical protein n=1 Tax=Streptomyces goshikiensis TaxID=1942 RepID=UPI00371F26B7